MRKQRCLLAGLCFTILAVLPWLALAQQATTGNLPWQIVFGFHESMVTTTIASGKVLMQDRQLLTLDEEAIAAHARQLAPAVWERYYAQF